MNYFMSDAYQSQTYIIMEGIKLRTMIKKRIEFRKGIQCRCPQKDLNSDAG